MLRRRYVSLDSQLCEVMMLPARIEERDDHLDGNLGRVVCRGLDGRDPKLGVGGVDVQRS